jgi:peptide deformylase
MVMSILKVARMGHPVLRSRAQAIPSSEIKSAVVQRLIEDMIDTMVEYHGVGLAAPQVHEGLRLFVAVLEPGNGAGNEEASVEPIAIVNPEITVVGDELVEDWEGCLSIPDIRGRVPRARDVRMRAHDLHGYPARVAQHETDHLDGILFFDRMRWFDSLTFLDEYSRYWAKD